VTVERRTVKQWCHYLETPDIELTLSEFMALCLLHIRENVKDSREGTQHLEGMVGSLDEMMAASNDVYKVIASRRSKPMPVLPPNGEALR
jgi:hypothetical protein